MKPSEPNPEEILKVKYSDDKWEPDFEGILEAMREYAEAYHKAKLREELINYVRWFGPENMPIEFPTSEGVFVDKYLNRQK